MDNVPKYRVYELADPHEADIPKAIIWRTPAGMERLWHDRESIGGSLGAWLRGLDREPVRLSGGVPIGLWSADDCRRLVAARVQWLESVCGGRPAWLVVPEKPSGPRPVIRDCGGCVDRFPSISAARRRTGYARDSIRRWLTGIPDCDGCAWRAD